MKFNQRVKEVMKESLVEGNADYSDVLDSLDKLKQQVEHFSQMYPAGRTNDVHASYKAEIDRICSRFDKWMQAQLKFTQRAKAMGDNPMTQEIEGVPQPALG